MAKKRPQEILDPKIDAVTEKLITQDESILGQVSEILKQIRSQDGQVSEIRKILNQIRSEGVSEILKILKEMRDEQRLVPARSWKVIYVTSHTGNFPRVCNIWPPAQPLVEPGTNQPLREPYEIVNTIEYRWNNGTRGNQAPIRCGNTTDNHWTRFTPTVHCDNGNIRVECFTQHTERGDKQGAYVLPKGTSTLTASARTSTRPF